MKRLSPALLVSILLPLSSTGLEGNAGTRMFTLEEVSGRGRGPSLVGELPQWSWAKGGERLRKGRGDAAKTIDPSTFEELEPSPIEEGPDESTIATDAMIAALAKHEEVDEKTAAAALRRPVSGGRDDSVRIVAANKSFYRVDRHHAARIDAPPSAELFDVAPDGASVTFVEENDLYVWTEKGGAKRITTDGSVSQLNGKLDWVYQEEIYGRGTFKASWWSPDSQSIAFLSLDESKVEAFTVIDHIETGHFRVKPEVTSYPKVGDPNPSARLGLYSLRTDATRFVDLSSIEASEPLIVRVEWAPSGKLLFVAQDRTQTWATLNAVDPTTAAWTTWIRETNDTWVDRPSSPRFLDDGSFLWLSDRTDHRHIYRYRADQLQSAVTQGEWSVDSIDAIDEPSQRIWFTSNKDGAINRNLYRIGFDGKGLKRLTQGGGAHTTSFNHDRSMFLDSFSSLTQVPRVRLCDGDGNILRELDEAKIPALDEFLTSRWEVIEIEARDGFKLDAALLKPVPFDPQQSYPVWIPTYSGPDAPSVTNRWNTSTYNQFLAQQGFIVLQVNVRTASGKGHYATEQCYKRLGIQELHDLEDAVDWITRNRWADAHRVGIGGYSFGGFISALALTHSSRFALGIAGGGVYDWRMYDTIYTERYMSTPDRNPDGYRETSVLGGAASLKGHLLMHHGVMDDNVHVQNAMQLAYALQKEGKEFEMMLYPQNRHGVRDRDQRWHLRQLEWKTMKRILGGARSAL